MIIQNINAEFFSKLDRRLKNLIGKVGDPNCLEPVYFPRAVIEALADGQLQRGAVFADEIGRVYFNSYDLGQGRKIGPRRPKTVDTPVTPVTELIIIIEVRPQAGDVSDVSAMLLSALSQAQKGGAHANN